jgi:uncharacterized membrane protein YbhN (UPF0104 family)
MHILRSPRRLVATLGVLIFVWATDLGMVVAVLYAVGIHLPLAGAVLILFTLNLTIAVPSTPAQVGALEVGALAGIDMLGVSHEAGLAFALLYHAIQVVPLIAVGLLLELRLVLGRDMEPAALTDDEEVSANDAVPPASQSPASPPNKAVPEPRT